MEKSMYKVAVIVDMQKDFTTGALGNKACEAVIPKIVDVIAYGGYDEVFLTRDTHDEHYLETQEGRKLPVVHTQRGGEGWQIVPAIMEAVHANCEADRIHVIDKPTFGSEELMLAIKDIAKNYKEYGELQVDFMGVCTGICVISNVLPAKMAAPEATIRVIDSACACVTPESHRTAIEAMRTCQVDIV